jgi:monoamine oxidase
MPRHAAAALFEPLCVAALNTPPERASAQVFASVLDRAFAGIRGASDLLVPSLDLSELFPDAAARAIEARRGAIHLNSTMRIAALGAAGVTLATRHGTHEVSDVVLAVAPHQLAAAFTGPSVSAGAIAPLLANAKSWRYEPITTVYLGFAAPFAPPAHVTRLDDQPGQWAFDRRDILRRAPEAARALRIHGLIAVVISADGESRAQEPDTLAGRVDGQLRRLRPELPPLGWSRVIRERRATYACEPEVARPRWGRLAEHLYLAGDYTDPELPATLEAAVRSGEAAAHALLRARGIEPGRTGDAAPQLPDAPARERPPPGSLAD